MPRSEYSLDLINTICARIAEGETATAALEAIGVPRRTFFGWVREYAEVGALYQSARLARAESYRDKIAEINEKLEHGSIDPQSAREITNNLKWLASKDAPASFGDKAAVEVTGKDGKDLIPDQKDDLELARYMALILDRADKKLRAQEAESEQAQEPRRLLTSNGAS